MQKFLVRAYLVILAVLILFAAVGHEGRFLGWSADQHSEKPDTLFALADVQKLFPAAVRIDKLSVDEAFAVDNSGKKVGKLVHTFPQAAHIIGYASNLPILIGLDADEKIVGIVLQANGETPGFINRLEKQQFFNTWDRMPASEVVNGRFDAVTRATMTTQATIDGLKLRLGSYLALEQERKRVEFRMLMLEILAWFFLALSLAGAAFPARLARYRTLLLILAVLLPGFALGRFVSLELIRVWAVNGIPFAAQPYLALVLILCFVLPFFTGRSWYCSWYCPYGAAQELLGRVFKRKLNPGGAWLELLKWVRSGFLTGIVFLLIIGTKLDLSLVEPFPAFMFRSAADSVIILALVFLVLSLFIRKPWCNFVCPSGQIVELVRTWPLKKNAATDLKEKNRMKFQEIISLLLAVALAFTVLNSGGRVAVVEGEKSQIREETAKMSEPDTKTVKKDDEKNVAMTVFKNIYERKSVRNYTGRQVSKEQLGMLVKAGMAAPTGRNVQPWQFIAVNDKAVLEKLTEALPYAKMLASAGAAIVVCGDLEIARAGNTEQLWVQDCSAATQNILLAAESMGLGAVWTAAHPYEDRIKAVVEALQLPEHVVPLNVIPVGYPTGVDKPKDKWKPERLHWNGFKLE